MNSVHVFQLRHLSVPRLTETNEASVLIETSVHTETPAHLFLFSFFQSTDKTVSQLTDSGEKDMQVLRQTDRLGKTEFSFI